jgi:hypothetical protein
MTNRLDNLRHFYELIDSLDSKLGGKQRLSDCNGKVKWPLRGVYFFFERGEVRSESGTGPRVVRVGTHGLTSGSRSTVWGRLAQHRGSRNGLAGNHRGSVFRLLVGAALSARHRELQTPTSGQGQSAQRAIRDAEQELERAVSTYIGAMPFLWLKWTTILLRPACEPTWNETQLPCSVTRGLLSHRWTLHHRNGSAMIVRMRKLWSPDCGTSAMFRIRMVRNSFKLCKLS